MLTISANTGFYTIILEGERQRVWAVSEDAVCSSCGTVNCDHVQLVRHYLAIGGEKARPMTLKDTVFAPHNLSVEKGLLGALLMQPELFEQIESEVAAEHFHEQVNQWVFSAMARLHSRGDPIDPLTVKDELGLMGKLSEVGQGYLVGLVTDVPTNPQHARSYARIIRRLYHRRQIVSLASKFVARACSENIAFPALLEEITEEMRSFIMEAREKNED